MDAVQLADVMAALLQQGCGLGAYQHVPFVLAQQIRQSLFLIASQPMALSRMVQGLQFSTHFGGQRVARRVPQGGIIQRWE